MPLHLFSPKTKQKKTKKQSTFTPGTYSRLTLRVGVRPKAILAPAYVHVTVVHVTIVAGEFNLVLALANELLAEAPLHGHTVAVSELCAEDLVQMGAVGVAHAADNLTAAVAAMGTGIGTDRLDKNIRVYFFCFVFLGFYGPPDTRASHLLWRLSKGVTAKRGVEIYGRLRWQ